VEENTRRVGFHYAQRGIKVQKLNLTFPYAEYKEQQEQYTGIFGNQSSETKSRLST
jgi:hypothetical protein